MLKHLVAANKRVMKKKLKTPKKTREKMIAAKEKQVEIWKDHRSATFYPLPTREWREKRKVEVHKFQIFQEPARVNDEDYINPPQEPWVAISDSIKQLHSLNIPWEVIEMKVMDRFTKQLPDEKSKRAKKEIVTRELQKYASANNITITPTNDIPTSTTSTDPQTLSL
eukprot:TRINITY_DN65_c0_g1_i1.p1 TRINITY_DN65_c0_g1~~TRINITY_DN65_c0_g1_i1.p1  ORF type:complete len:178 (-),score=57.21 TRINITY_DN65_c0_g1_i1:22-525(-)